jgi:hypothetical protein
VKEYWIINPEARSVEGLSLEQGSFPWPVKSALAREVSGLLLHWATSPGSISVFSVSVCQRFNLNAHQEGKAKANN